MQLHDIRKKADDKGSVKKFKDYHFDLFDKFMQYASPQGRDVAVLGCSTGLDCQLFVLAGASNVIGIDLDPRIGSDYSAKNLSYLKSSITNISELENNSLDIVYSVAVFEHVFDIPGALNECCRVLKPGGVAYVLSSPLWNSPFGHHYKVMLEEYPWIHLVIGEQELLEFLRKNGLEKFNGVSLNGILNYIYHPSNFNRFPAAYYYYAGMNIEGVELVENKISTNSLDMYSNKKYFYESLNKGHSADDLLSTMHLLVFRKL